MSDRRHDASGNHNATSGYALVSTSESAYPRRGQRIVPLRLADLLVDGALPAAATDAKLAGRLAPRERRTVANRAVRWLRSKLPTLPATVASGRMPPPATLLKALLLDTRTRNVLLRCQAENPKRKTWSVRDYLALPGFGPRGLLDVLTSLEASQARQRTPRATPPQAPPSTPGVKLGAVLERVERVQRKYRREDLRPAPPSLAPARFADGDYLAKTIELIIPELPLSDQAIRERLRAAGIKAEGVDLVRLAKAASRLSLESSFVVIALGSGKLVLRRRDVPLATGAYSIAVRTTLNWGVATIAGVTSQLSTVAGATASAGFVERVLATARGFEWLDEGREWFWFRHRPSRLMDSAHKIFSVVHELSLQRLYWALFKGHDERLRPPALSLQALARALPGARIERDLLALPHRLDQSTYLSRDERALVEILDGSQGGLSPHALRASAAARSISSRAILAFMRASPLIEVLPDGRCCLIGAAVGDAGRWASS